MKRVISVGAGANDIPLIERMNSLGFKVAAVDPDPGAPGKELCDAFKAVDPGDSAAAVEWLESLEAGFLGAACFGGGRGAAVRNEIARRFDLPVRVSDEALAASMSKTKLRESLAEKSLGRPGEYTASEARESMGGALFRIHALVSKTDVKFFSLLHRENVGTDCISRLQPVYNVEPWANRLVSDVVSGFGVEDAALRLDAVRRGNEVEITGLDWTDVSAAGFAPDIAPLCYGYEAVDQYIEMITGGVAARRILARGRYTCCDFIYNLDGENARVADREKICAALEPLVGAFETRAEKSDGERAEYPASESDALMTIFHSRPEASSAEINRAATEAMPEARCS